MCTNYKSDVLWVTVPNHADWLYKTGEKATVEVQFYKYGIPRDNVTVTYEIGGDMMPVADTKGSATLKNGYLLPEGTRQPETFLLFSDRINIRRRIAHVCSVAILRDNSLFYQWNIFRHVLWYTLGETSFVPP